MNDYISRQEALDLIESAGTWGWSESQLYDEISELTASDVRPVKRGEWVNHYRSGFEVKDGFVSSCCDMWNNRKSDFCPHCGGDMRGKHDATP